MREERLDCGVKILLIHRIDLSSDPQRNPYPLGDFNRMIRSLLGGDSSQECQIVSGIRTKAVQITWQYVLDGSLPIGPGDGFPLRIRNRHHRHFLILSKHRLQFRKIETAVERGHRWGWITSRERETHEIEMGVNDVEISGFPQRLLH